MALAAPTPRPGVLDIEAYVPGESGVPGGMKPIKLSSNETPLGPSPKAIAAFKDAAGHLERYPDGQATALRQAIARRYGLNADRIVCGAGSDELISLDAVRAPAERLAMDRRVLSSMTAFHRDWLKLPRLPRVSGELDPAARASLGLVDR